MSTPDKIACVIGMFICCTVAGILAIIRPDLSWESTIFGAMMFGAFMSFAIILGAWLARSLWDSDEKNKRK